MLQSLELDRVFVAERDAQIREIEAEISKLQVEEQVAALKDSIPVLHTSKKLAQQRLDSYKYPVFTLPNEIVSVVFVHFLPTYPEPPRFFGPRSPFTLTHICRRWREIALTTPELWRAIHLGFGGETAALLAPLWLERSGCLPLSIRVADSPAELLDFQSIFGALIPHRARWEQLDLNLYNPKDLEVLDGPLPLLRTLSVYLDDHLRNPLLLQTVPLLRTAVLDDYGLLGLILPWSQLTSLTLRVIYSSKCVPILRQAQNLVSCTLTIYGLHNMPDDWIPVLTLPRLETLVFHRDSISYGTELLSFFITPALRSLEIGEASVHKKDPIASLNSFILKSGCTLNELRITWASIDEVVYRKAFPSIPIVICGF
ncbi:F-box domain-containing protein [Favolaschia claudopus]|uniref:F-box domain-containing protein n=1 Tax=Favolaschia claudopus TaxID=2862362 RepID=A0AAW0DNE0_9AGAR